MNLNSVKTQQNTTAPQNAQNVDSKAMYSHTKTAQSETMHDMNGLYEAAHNIVDQKIEQNTADTIDGVNSSSHNLMKNNRMQTDGASVMEKSNTSSVKNTDSREIPESVADIPFYKPMKQKRVRGHTRFLNLYQSIVDRHDKKIKPTPRFILAFVNLVRNRIKERENIDVADSINLVDISMRISRDLPTILPLDDFYTYTADSLISLSSHHHYYGLLASYVCVLRLHSITTPSLLETANLLQINLDKNNDPSPVLSDEIFNLIKKHHKRLQAVMDMDRDFDFDYFGLKTLERSYLYKLQFTKYKVIERPQHLIMRVALGIHGHDIEAAIETYELMSQRLFTHATPTLFNSGTRRAQMSSCFLQSVDDSIESILEAVRDIGYTSKWSGGIGVHLSALRARGSLIRGTNGLSLGIIPLCVMLNKEAKYINQGGKRNGSIACFCEDTEVFTVNNGVKKIKDIQIGDKVVTHKNRVKSVSQVHKNPLGDRKIYKLEVQRNKDIYVTGNHKFWSFHTKKYKNKKLSHGWNSVDELKAIMDSNETTRQACYIATPEATNIVDTHDYAIDIMDYEHIILNNGINRLEIKGDKVSPITISTARNGDEKMAVSHSVNRVWNIDEDFANLIGIWLGDGHIRKARTGGKILGIDFTVHSDNQDEIDFITNTCERIFGCNITKYSPKNRNVTHITVNSRVIGIVFHELFGAYFDGKKLPNQIFEWPKRLINGLIAGLITADGHIASKKCNATLGMSNEGLMTELYHLCRNNGIAVSYVKYKRGKGMTCDPYSMSIPLNIDILNGLRKLYTDDRIDRCRERLNENNDTDNYLKILNITETDRTDEYVYTMGVEDDHSYTVEGLLAENCYLEPWHADIYDFCDLRKDTGNDDNRAHDLYLALWIPDLFMERVKNDGAWSLMCPDECPGLNLVHSDQFKRLYEQYEKEGRYKKQVRARDLWKHIVASQGETGFPYTLFKDHANSKSNQQNLGTIRSSNLCAEIVQYSDAEETAVCNLASVCLPRFIIENDDGTFGYDHERLMKVVRVIVRNLDKIIDRNYYPTEKTRVSNMRHRPMGIGVQGLADLFNMMGYGFDSPEAKILNKRVFESIYYAAVSESMELAKKHGPYSSFEGSEFSKGRLQYHLWGLTEDDMLMGYDWRGLIEEVKEFGTRNSLLTAIMPTASSSQIMGNSECCEPRMSNVFTRTTLAGMFVVVNPFLMKDLMKRGVWSEDMRKKLIIYNGSVQKIDEVPDDLKAIYKTAYELDQMHLVEQSADRGVFVDQSQSFNLFFAKPSFDLQTSALFGGWEAGLKTGEYYLRTQPAVNPIQFGIDIDDIKRLTGRKDIRDFISDSYGVDSDVITSDNSDSSEETDNSSEDAPTQVCMWKPGMAPPDCLACGA